MLTRRSILMLAASLALPACVFFRFSEYDTMDQLTPAHHALFTNLETYYLAKAKEQAAFSLNCPQEQLTSKVVSVKLAHVSAVDEPAKWTVIVKHGTVITTIGVEGCSRRASYQVLCSPEESYGVPSGACDVIPSSEAVRTAAANNQEQERLEEQQRQQQEPRPQPTK